LGVGSRYSGVLKLSGSGPLATVESLNGNRLQKETARHVSTATHGVCQHFIPNILGDVMVNPLDNGGPPTDVSAKMRWVRVNISDILEGMEGLTWEQRGFYCTALFKMYARQDGIPFDDRAGSSVVGCNPRTFRCHRDALLSRGKFYVDAGTLRNSRVEREIAEFCREVKRRRDAALEREKRRREAAKANAVQPELEANSSRIQPEFEPNSTRTDAAFAPNWDEKANRNNVCDATALVKENHSASGNQKPETRNQIKNSHQQSSKRPTADAHELFERLSSAANGSLYPLAVNLQVVAEPIGWIEAGADLEKDIIPVVKALGHKAKPQSIRSWSYFAGAVSQARDARLRGLPPPVKDPSKPKRASRWG
jgi:uncharacterized protein YdaU (DUF1376 family)